MSTILSHLLPTRLPIQKPYSLTDLSLTRAVASPSFLQNRALLAIYRIFTFLPLVFVFCADATLGTCYRLTLGNHFISQINQKNQKENSEHLKSYLLKAAVITGVVTAGALIGYHYWKNGSANLPTASSSTPSPTPTASAATPLTSSWLSSFSSLPTNIVPWIGLPITALTAYKTGSPSVLVYGAALTAGLNKAMGPGFDFKDPGVCRDGFGSASPLQSVNAFVNKWEILSYVGAAFPLFTLVPSLCYDLFHRQEKFKATKASFKNMLPEMASALLNKAIMGIPYVRSKDGFNTSGHALTALPFVKASEKAAEGAEMISDHLPNNPLTIASYAISTIFAAANALMMYNTVSSCHRGMEMLAGFGIATLTSVGMHYLISPLVKSDEVGWQTALQELEQKRKDFLQKKHKERNADRFRG